MFFKSSWYSSLICNYEFPWVSSNVSYFLCKIQNVHFLKFTPPQDSPMQPLAPSRDLSELRSGCSRLFQLDLENLQGKRLNSLCWQLVSFPDCPSSNSPQFATPSQNILYFNLWNPSLTLFPYEKISSVFSKTTLIFWKTLYIPSSFLFSMFYESSCSLNRLPDVWHQLPNRQDALLIPSAS